MNCRGKRKIGRILLLLTPLVVFMLPDQALMAETSGVSITPVLVEDSLAPGESKTYSVIVNNLSQKDQSYILEVNDIIGINSESLPIYVTAAEPESERGLSHYLDLPVRELELEPGDSREIDYIIHIPNETKPGGYYGGISIKSLPAAPSGSGAAVSYKATNLIAVTVDGSYQVKASVPEFTIENNEAAENTVEMKLVFENQGDVHLRPYGQVEIFDLWGRKVETILVNHTQAAVFPNSQKIFKVEWNSERSRFGRYTAIISMTYGQDGNSKTLVNTDKFWLFDPLGALITSVAGIAVFVATYKLAARLVSPMRATAARRNYRKSRINWPQLAEKSIRIGLACLLSYLLISLVLRFYA